LAMLAEAEVYRNSFVAIGLASSEAGNPPSKFEQLYASAEVQGYKLTAHAGEEGPPSYIWDSLNRLNVARIDHGVRCVEDQALVEYLRERQIALTVCPLSNIKLCVFDSMQQHNVLELLDSGILVTINSDDPAYFGGDLTQNFEALNQSLDCTRQQTIKLIENSFKASFLQQKDKEKYLAQLYACVETG